MRASRTTVLTTANCLAYCRYHEAAGVCPREGPSHSVQPFCTAAILQADPTSQWLNKCKPIRQNPNVLLEIPDFIWRRGVRLKVLKKIHLIKEIYDNIQHILFLGKLFNKIKVSPTLNHVPFHFATELMETALKIILWKQVSTLCLLITLLRIT